MINYGSGNEWVEKKEEKHICVYSGYDYKYVSFLNCTVNSGGGNK